MPDEKKPTYAVERLVQEAQDFLGVSSHVAAGAFSTVRKKELSVDEAKQLIDRWLKKPVEEDNPVGVAAVEED